MVNRVNRELKQRRFWMTQVNRKWRLFPVHIPWRHHICLVKCLLETNCLKMWANRCPRIQIHFRLTCVAHERSCSSSLILPPDFVRLLDFAPLNLPSESLFRNFHVRPRKKRVVKARLEVTWNSASSNHLPVTQNSATPFASSLSFKSTEVRDKCRPEPKAEAINFFNKKSFSNFFTRDQSFFFLPLDSNAWLQGWNNCHFYLLCWSPSVQCCSVVSQRNPCLKA